MWEAWEGWEGGGCIERCIEKGQQVVVAVAVAVVAALVRLDAKRGVWQIVVKRVAAETFLEGRWNWGWNRGWIWGRDATTENVEHATGCL